MSLLSLCQDIAADIPIAQPATIINNSDTKARLLLACAQRAGKHVAKYKGGGWSVMGREVVFPTVAITITGTAVAASAVITGIQPNTAGLSAQLFGAVGSGVPGNTYIASVDSSSQVTLTNPILSGYSGAIQITFGQWAYALPSDFRRTITDTEWDRQRRWPLIGPRSPQQWQLYKSGLIGVATFQRRWRIKPVLIAGAPPTDYFCLDPVPTDNGSDLVFEYISNAWCASIAGATQTSWQADSDIALIEEDLISLEARWRFLARSGLAYDAERDEAEREIAKAFALDGGMPIFDMAPVYGTTLVGPYNIPDTGYGNISS